MNKEQRTLRKPPIFVTASKDEQTEVEELCRLIEAATYTNHKHGSETGPSSNKNSNNCNNSRQQRSSRNRSKAMNNFKCLYLNADSLPNKLDELHVTVDEIKPTLIAVTEVSRAAVLALDVIIICTSLDAELR